MAALSSTFQHLEFFRHQRGITVFGHSKNGSFQRIDVFPENRSHTFLELKEFISCTSATSSIISKSEKKRTTNIQISINIPSSSIRIPKHCPCQSPGLLPAMHDTPLLSSQPCQQRHGAGSSPDKGTEIRRCYLYKKESCLSSRTICAYPVSCIMNIYRSTYL